MPVAGGHTLALSSVILANLMRCLAETTVTRIDPHQNCPLWVFQFWLQVYFATLRPEIPSFKTTQTLGLQLASRPAPPHSVEEIFKYFFDLEDLSNDEFLICRAVIKSTHLPSNFHPQPGLRSKTPTFDKTEGRSC
ncbi:hypothetical protein ACFXTH_019321 [Malus domestica]